MIQDSVQTLLHYEEKEKYIKISTLSDCLLVEFPLELFSDDKNKSHFQNNEKEYYFKKDKQILMQTRIKQLRNNYHIQITFQNLYRKYQIGLLDFFKFQVYKLQEKIGQDIKIYLKDKYLTFQISFFLNKNNSKQFIADFIQDQKQNINRLIIYFDNLVSSQKSNNYSSQLDINQIQNLDLLQDIRLSNQSYINIEQVRLLQQISVLKIDDISKTIVIQNHGQQDLLKVQFKHSFKINNTSFNLIMNRTLSQLEQPINQINKTFNIRIQKIIPNLFIKCYFEFDSQTNFIFQDYEKLKDYLNRFKQKYDTFEIRLHLLIQIYCLYLLINEINQSQKVIINEIIRIDSNKQIKIDFLEYLNQKQEIVERNDTKNEQQQAFLMYFEQLLPKIDKQIYIGDYNLTKELEKLKQQIVKDEIKLSSLIIRLLTIEDLIKEKMNSLFFQSII